MKKVYGFIGFIVGMFLGPLFLEGIWFYLFVGLCTATGSGIGSRLEKKK